MESKLRGGKRRALLFKKFARPCISGCAKNGAPSRAPRGFELATHDNASSMTQLHTHTRVCTHTRARPRAYVNGRAVEAVMCGCQRTCPSPPPPSPPLQSVDVAEVPDPVVIEAFGTRAHVEKAERMLRCQHADVMS